jgi:hypothetical protein
VGTCLFIGCGVGKTTIAKVTRTMLAFFAAMIAALLIITYVPSMSLWLPVQTNQLKKTEVEQSRFMKTSSDTSDTPDNSDGPDSAQGDGHVQP